MSKTRNIFMSAGLAALMAQSAWATDFTALRNDQRVHGELLAASMAYIVADNCPSINLRRLTMVGKALSLQSYAKSLGYSGREISSYVDSKDEQARFRAIAEPYLQTKGAVPGDAESYCTAGRVLMEKGTLAGSFLKGG